MQFFLTMKFKYLIYTKFKKWKFLLSLSIIVIIIILKIPSILFQEMPPYTFCDENIFVNAAFKMFKSNNWIITEEFRSGGFNIYMPLISAYILNTLSILQIENKEFLIISRFISNFVLFLIGVYYLKKILKTLRFNLTIQYFALFLYILSPVVLALSRIHYPDHYILPFVFIAIYSSLKFKFFINKYFSKYLLILSITSGILISVKYTAILLVPFILLLIFLNPNNNIRLFRFKYFFVNSILFLITFALIILFFNISAFFNPEYFFRSWNYNYYNYRMDDPFSLITALNKGILFYSKIIFFQFFGFVFFIFYLVGNYSFIADRRYRSLLILNIPIYFFIIKLGVYFIYFNRNILMVLPFFLFIGLYGLQYIYNKIEKKYFNISILFILLILESLLRTGIIIRDDFKQDSRFAMEEYISSSIAVGSIIGYGWSCFTPPPFPKNKIVAAYKQDQDVDYYLVNSWWDSGDYLNEGENYPSFFGWNNYRDFHFTHYTSSKGGSDTKNSPNLDFHSRFELVKKIEGSGPTLTLYKSK